jgi:hypothetical protein
MAQVVEPEVRDARFPAGGSEAVLNIRDVTPVLSKKLDSD